ncbi:MAG: NAD(P)H-dependent oxidoreductase [Actinomycetia bacterium]|nr:NAD(P)H-dependent oxidoreductase [Actinomycetes bacterium]
MDESLSEIPDPMGRQERSIAFVPGSRRADSVNVALAELSAAIATDLGCVATVVHLDDFAMPMYDGDCEDEVGVPDAAARLHDVLVASEIVVLVSPEYNGAPTPLLKNAIDWVTRVSKRPLENKTVGLMSATPGSGGGTSGLKVLSVIMASLRVNHEVPPLGVGKARSRIADNDPVLRDEIERFVSSLLVASAGNVPA